MTTAEYFISEANWLENKIKIKRQAIVGIASLATDALTNRPRVIRFKIQLEIAIKEWDEFQKLWEQRLDLHGQVPNDNFPSEQWLQIYNETQEEIIVGRAALMEIRSNENQEVNPAPDLTQLLTTLAGRGGARSHLPKITIPRFSGNLLQWAHFRDTFVSMVHDEGSLSDVEKFHHLLSALEGEAASLISHLPVEERSYTQAWEKLISEYDNPRILANLYLQRIIDCDISGTREESTKLGRFISEVADSMDAFRGLQLEDPAEFLLSYLALRALDPYTRRQFEVSRDTAAHIPVADDIVEFVRHRLTALKLSRAHPRKQSSPQPDKISRNSSKPISGPQRNHQRYKAVTLHTTSEPRFQEPKINPVTSSGTNGRGAEANAKGDARRECVYCHAMHSTASCIKFLGLSPQERNAFVNGRKACRNCLESSHRVDRCPSKWTCKLCKLKHHSLLHEDCNSRPEAGVGHAASCAPKNRTQPKTFTGFGSSDDQEHAVLLGTIQTIVKGKNNGSRKIRAVLDCGSQNSFVSTEVVKQLGLTITEYNGSVTGLGESPLLKPLGSVLFVIKPFGRNEQYKIRAVVVDRISTALPNVEIPHEVAQQLKGHKLADYYFDLPAPVDLLIGCNICYELINGAPYTAEVDGLFLLPTVFGLVVTGTINIEAQTSQCSLFTESRDNIQRQLAAFWEIEEPEQLVVSQQGDDYCESHFKRTHYRNPDGRYVVFLPLCETAPLLGNNREVVKRRFLNLENRFKRDPALAVKYKEFMNEYIALGHMSPAPSESSYLVPHHAVWQDKPEGRKLRVVFDASCPSSGNNLNDTLLTGPKLQADLSTILVQFRLFRIPLCADIVKMYRQILIHESQRHLQHIFWREDPGKSLIEFQLNTLTYGLRPSAFLAMRAVKQLVVDEGKDFPMAAACVSRAMYVDDVVTGADTLEQARELKIQLCGFFSRGGFELSKWASNVPELASDQGQHDFVPIGNEGDHVIKILGLVWNPRDDTFTYSVRAAPTVNVTKRKILSFIARIFDPLGFLAPVILRAKILLQEVWKENLGWDDPLPTALTSVWTALTNQWKALANIRIPRYIKLKDARQKLVGFCDASSQGYAAAIYLVSDDPEGNETKVSLIKAKTKVAPLKYVSTARLELCGALLLAKLIATVKLDHLEVGGCTCFTDSQVALSWIRAPQHKLRVFEANRVAQITDLTSVESWRHVRSEDNPADIASRGSGVVELMSSQLWWHGPCWLKKPSGDWPNCAPRGESSDCNLFATSSSSGSTPQGSSWVTKFSSYITVIRVIAWILRWRYLRTIQRPTSSSITAEEYLRAKCRFIYIAQREYLPFGLFGKGKDVPKVYQSLRPFVDEQGIIRVGGRLNNAPIDFSAKHPALIPRGSHYAKLIVNHFHQQHYHAGPTLTLALIRGEYWIPGGLKYVRDIITRCVHCRIRKAQPTPCLMAPLPKVRFSQFRAFLQVGTDFAGPFLVKESNRRKAALGKAYICIFICMASRAVHIEAVSSLSTEAFLASLDRFIARRGVPKTISSDNGTNFVGASRFLKDLYSFMAKQEQRIVDYLSPKGVEWAFIPPRAPHFGGIWEAGVKSVKNLLLSNFGKTPWTFEELATALIKIEGLLNSRPLGPLTEDPQSFDVLTPAHFLIGAPLSCIPEEALQEIPKTFASRWAAVQQQVNHVWERWRREFLHTLQQRAKWRTSQPSLNVNDLVVMVEKRSLLGQWPVGRVVQTHPGKDGVTRVVTVRTPSGSTFVRPANSLIPLIHTQDTG